MKDHDKGYIKKSSTIFDLSILFFFNPIPMKKLYCLTLLVISLNCTYGQTIVEARKTSASRYQFVDKVTGVKLNDLTWDETESFSNGFANVAFDHKWGFVDQNGNPVIK